MMLILRKGLGRLKAASGDTELYRTFNGDKTPFVDPTAKPPSDLCVPERC